MTVWLQLVPGGWGPVFRALLVSEGSLGHSSLSWYPCFGYRHGSKISLRVHILFFELRTGTFLLLGPWFMCYSALAGATFIHPVYGNIGALSHGASRCFFQSTFPTRWIFWYFRKVGHLELVSGPGAISISRLLSGQSRFSSWGPSGTFSSSLRPSQKGVFRFS